MDRTHVEFPAYAELLTRTDAPPGSAWGVFGDDDEIGTLNHLTPQRVLSGIRAVRTGEMFNLDLPLGAFDPPLVPSRKNLRHTLFANNPYHRDEYVDSFYTQAGSQIDGLRHIGNPQYGFYNGADPQRFAAQTPFLGINRLTEHGIAGRAVLLDVDRHRRAEKRPIDHAGGEAIPISDVIAAAERQQVGFEHGDILLLRTGWAHHHLNEIDDHQRRAATDPIRASGLLASHETVAWLWDRRFSLVATDNFAVESWPAPKDSPFVTRAERSGAVKTDGHSGLMHRALIPLLGMVLGELWDLESLAARCASDGRWDCLVVASPLHLTGGAGSPANAVAIR